MKKHLLLFGFIALFSNVLNAQCIPGSLVNAGLLPTPAQSLPFGGIDEPYSTDVSFKFQAPATVTPSDLGVPTIPGFDANIPLDFQADYYVVVVQGLPNGLTSSCNASNCQYLDEQLGCINISGTPTTIGSYNVTISANFYGTALGAGNLGLTGLPNIIPVGGSLTLPAIPPLLPGGTFQISPANVNYGSHKLLITATSVFENDNQSISVKNFPNPFSDFTDILIYTKEISAINIHILDVNGKLVKTNFIDNVLGEYNYRLDSQGLKGGVYFCQVDVNGKKSVFKIVIEKR
jgi:hypothetical protein